MNNVMLYLGIIEKRITEMFNKVHWMDKTTKSEAIRLDEEKKPKLNVPALPYIVPTQPCALWVLPNSSYPSSILFLYSNSSVLISHSSCVEKEEMQYVSEGLDAPLTRTEAERKLEERLNDDCTELLHNISGCHLPAARKIMQKRYQ